MSQVIQVRGVSKQFEIGLREPYGTLRDSLARTAGSLKRRFRGGSGTGKNTIWALNDVSFTVRDGELLGIIGRNGSGKSTLLKILSRITEPTRGYALIAGRVGSLLEVGTGFHPELTGRENVFVNGAILGMRRKEIDAQFDAIVAFAQVETFIDTPVKHYSSGMHLRLAFAVAAHLQPNILLVDEVLAVGDAEFQRRCLGKMQEVSRQGRTVILVSHQMNQIRRLCDTCLWLDKGTVQFAGDAREAIRRYEHAVTSSGESLHSGTHFTRWELSGGQHTVRDTSRPINIRAHVRLDEPIVNGHYGVGLLDDQDTIVAGWAFEPIKLAAGRHVLDVTLPQLPLKPGSYRVTFALFNGGNNLSGGVLIEKWHAAPLLTLDVVPVAHPQDAWAGFLNIPATLTNTDAVELTRSEPQVAIASARR